MKINISEIVKTDGAFMDVEIHENMPVIDTITEDVSFSKPVRFTGRLLNVSGVIKLEGMLQVEYSVECFRCLKKLEKTLDLPVKEDFLSSEKNTDLEAYTYEGHLLDMEKVLTDSVFLNLPMKQVCSDSCRGLCSHCGVNLNEKECDCEKESLYPKMEALDQYFKN